MAALDRMGGHRFVGVRDTMVVYDCEVDDQAGVLGRRIERDDLMRRDLIQTFAPDTEAEAANRGFHPPR